MAAAAIYQKMVAADLIGNCFRPIDDICAMICDIPAHIRAVRATLNKWSLATATNPTTLWRILGLLCRALYSQWQLKEFTREQSLARDALLDTIYTGNPMMPPFFASYLLF